MSTKNNKYEILPVKIEKKISEKWKSIPEYMPIHAFCMLISAPPKSGKSNMLVNLLINPEFGYIEKFDKVVILSPSILSDKTMKPIVDISEDEDNPLSDKIKIFTGDDLDETDELLKLIVEEQDSEPETETLVILDDMLGKLKKGEFAKLCARYRHKNMSLIAISQMWKAFDVISRACASHLILFKTHNAGERGKILEELAGFEGASDYFDEATHEKHSFLYVNNDYGSLYRCFLEELYKK
jgi:hypothetical protein